MKKLICILSCLICLSGCSAFKQDDIYSEDSAYMVFYNALKDNTAYADTPVDYSLSYEVTANGDRYLYYIIIDNTKVAMMNLRVMALEDATKDTLNESAIYPNLGLTEESAQVNLVPNQVESELGYQKGVSISGETTEAEPVIDLVISYNNENNTQSYRHYYQVKLTADGPVYTVTDKTEESEAIETVTDDVNETSDDIETSADETAGDVYGEEY